MRNLLAIVFCSAAVAFSDPATLVGQQAVTESQLFWSPNTSTSLYIAGTSGYLRDSVGVRRTLDTSINSVGGAGACTGTIVIRSGTAVQPQSHIEVSYRVRATDPSQAGFQMYLATRYRTPVTADTGWAIAGHQYVYDSSQVYLTHTNPGATSSFTTRFVNFWGSGQDVRVCFQRTSTGPGAGDTLVFSNNWLRAW